MIMERKEKKIYINILKVNKIVFLSNLFYCFLKAAVVTFHKLYGLKNTYYPWEFILAQL
jgi:hypothetical protein